MVNRLGGVRQTTHDPVTGVAFPCHASYVRPANGKRNTARYRLKVPDALCDRWGIRSRCITYTSLQALLDSDLYKRVVDEETRLNHSGTKRIKRTAACRDSTVREYEQLMRDGLQLPPQIRFRPESAVWAVTRTFGTGWTFRATALTYKDARRLYDECAKVRSVDEVIGNCQPTPKGTKRPFSRRILARADAESAAEKEAVDVVMAEEAESLDGEDVEQVEVEGVEVEEEDQEDQEEEEEEEYQEEEEVVDGIAFRSSRSGRVCKRPNLYSKEVERPQQQAKRRVARTAAAVGQPVLAVPVGEAGPSASALAAAPIPVYDDTEAMQSLKTIRERIAQLM